MMVFLEFISAFMVGVGVGLVVGGMIFDTYFKRK